MNKATGAIFAAVSFDFYCSMCKITGRMFFFT